MNVIHSETTGKYRIDGELTFDELLEAVSDLAKTVFQRGTAINGSSGAESYVKSQLLHLEREVFCVLFLDSQHRVIDLEQLFKGTIDCASVYPREVVKAAMRHNAAAVILAHNHPSGLPEPSQADINITKRISDALELVQVKTLDHIVVGSEGVVSMASRGLV